MKHIFLSIFILFLIIVILLYYLTKYIQKQSFSIPPLKKEDTIYPVVKKLITYIPNDLDTQTKRFLYFQYKYNMPLIIMFAQYLKALNYQYCFVSRDCYFLYKLYNKLYPSNSSIYFYSSRTAFKKGSPTFVEYTKYYTKRGYVWVDLGGINKTYYEFMKKHIGFIPPKIMLSIYWVVHKYQENITYLYINNNPNIEFFNRAPTPKIIDVAKYHIPIYAKDEKDDRLDFYNNLCTKSYEIILNHLTITELNSIKYNKLYMKYLLENISKF